MDYDDSALRALLESDFDRLTDGATVATQAGAAATALVTAMQKIVHDMTTTWNRGHATFTLPDELLATCVASLPLRDKVTASHVSHAWRHATLAFPFVWSKIDITSLFRDPAASFELAVRRAGQLPIDLDYMEVDGGSDAMEPMVDLVETYMHRLRHFSWQRQSLPGWGLRGARFFHFRGPAPLLESLITNVNVHVLDDFLSGQPGRLRVLHVPLLDLPRACPALRTVTDLRSHAPAYASTRRDYIRHVFQLVPNLRSLSLGDVTVALERMEPALAPPSLSHLRLECAPREDCNLSAIHQAWKTESFADVVLVSMRPPALSASLLELLAEAVFVAVNPEDLTLQDHKGRKCCLMWGYEARTHHIRPPCARETPPFRQRTPSPFRQPTNFGQTGPFGQPAPDYLADIASILLSAPLRRLQTLHVLGHAIPLLIDHLPRRLSCLSLVFVNSAPLAWCPFSGTPRSSSPLYDFSCLALLPRRFTSLATLRLDIIPDGGAAGRLSPDNARVLIAELAALQGPAVVREVCVRGVPEEVIEEIDAGKSLHDADGQTRIVFL